MKFWLAPLDLVSILEPLNWDKVEDDQLALKSNQMSVNVCNAIRELSLHDSELFEIFKHKIITVCRQNSILIDQQCYLSQSSLRRILQQDTVVRFGVPFSESENLLQSDDINPRGTLGFGVKKKENVEIPPSILEGSSRRSVITSVKMMDCDDNQKCRRSVYSERLAEQPSAIDSL